MADDNILDTEATPAAGPPAPLTEKPDTSKPEDDNEFEAAMRRDFEEGKFAEPGVFERTRLNFNESYFRGTISGSASLYANKKIMDDPTADPASRDRAKKNYQSVTNDLTDYELMRGYSGATEMLSSFAGQFAGALPSPETYIGGGLGRFLGKIGAKSLATIATEKIAGRIGASALEQAGVQVVTDPVVQALSIGSGAQKEYSWERTAASVALGGALGGVLHIPSEIFRRKSLALPTPEEEARTTRASADAAEEARRAAIVEDPSLAGRDDEITAKVSINEEASGPPSSEAVEAAQALPPEAMTERPTSEEAAKAAETETPAKAAAGEAPEQGLADVTTEPAATAEPVAAPEPLMPTAEKPDLPQGGGIEALDPATIGVDATRFQFKAGGDVEGITERLQGVEKWDPLLAGVVLVWRDADGKNWIADGHQRLGLAKRLGATQPDIRLNAFVLDATKGIGDSDARVIAAVKNIAEGTGTPIDAAKIFKEAEGKNINLPPLPPRSVLVKDGQALARLSPEAFGMVINEVVPVGHAASVGRLVSDPLQQVEAMRVLAKAQPENQRQAEMIVREIMATGTEEMTRQGGLFGDEAFASSVVLERAKIADEALKILKRDKSTFRTLVKEAEGIQTYGRNVLDVAANVERLTADEQAAQFLSQLATRKGPISDELTEIAKRLKSGEIGKSEAGGQFVEVIRRAIKEGVVTGPEPSGAIHGAAEPGISETAEAVRFEPGAEGKPQQLIPGVEPVTDLARAQLEAGKPLRGGEAAPPAGGLLDEEARAQADMQFRRGVQAPLQNAPAGPAPTGELISLQEQGSRLADEIGHPLRQGRVQGGQTALGQYSAQGVVRVRNVADFDTVAHEAGHYIEAKSGQDLTNLTNQHAAELGPMDYDPARASVSEGFGEFVRQYITAPQAALRAAPQFTAEFEALMRRTNPKMLDALQSARAAYAAWEAAPSGARIDAMVQTQEPETILASIKRDGLPTTISNVMRRVYEGLFDDLSPVTKSVRDLARLARDASGVRMSLEGADNPETLIRLLSRSHQASIRSMMDGVRPYHSIIPEGPSPRDAISRSAGSPGLLGRWDSAKVKELSNYLVARRVEYLWAKKDAGLLDRRPAAMTKADATNAIAEMERNNPNLVHAAQMIHDYTRQLLRKMFEGELIPREQYDALLAEDFYVPLYRDMTDKPFAAGGATAGGARTEGPGVTQLIKRMRGSDRDIIDPLQSITTQTFLVERAIAHNDAVLALRNMARAARAAGAVGTGQIVEEIPAHQVVGKKFDLAENLKAAAKQNGISEQDTNVLLGGLTDVFGDDPIIGTMFRREPTGKRGEPIVFYKEGGVLKALRVISKEEGIGLYESLTELPASMRDWAVTLGSVSATMLRAGVTTNPVFALTNFVRDQFAAGILRPDYIPFWDGLRGVSHELRQTETAQLYTAAGGVAAGAGRSGLSEVMDGHINALARKGWVVQRVGGLSDLVTKGDVVAGAKAIAEVVGVTESGTRLAVFKKVFDQKKAQGLSDYSAQLEAAATATDLLDFSRHGSGVEFIRKLVPFLNAQFQGLDKARRTIFSPLYRSAVGDIVTKQEEEEVRNAGIALFKLAGIGGSLGFAYGLWASQHEAYQDANDQLRATHMIVPGSAFGKPQDILLVPKPFELAMGFNLGEMAALAMHGDPRALKFALDGAYEIMTPPNPLESIPIAKLWAELKTGKSFFTGRDIVPEQLQKLEPSEQIKPTTSDIAKKIGKLINVSPIKVDYTIGQTFGSWGRDILAVSNTADPDAPASAMEDRMFLQRFVKSAGIWSETTRRYWELNGAVNGEYVQAKATYKEKVDNFKDDEANKYLSSLPAQKRAYVILTSAVDERGKDRYSSDVKNLHPLTRAGKAVSLINDYLKDLSVNTQTQIASGERVSMNPDKRRRVIDNLNILKGMEQRNALVILKEPGYENRKPLSTEDQLGVVRAIAPDVADEIETRYATAKIYSTDGVAKAWPEMQKRLIRDGDQAELRDLMYEAKGEGYAFGGQKVKKAKKRHVEIQAQPLQ